MNRSHATFGGSGASRRSGRVVSYSVDRDKFVIACVKVSLIERPRKQVDRLPDALSCVVANGLDHTAGLSDDYQLTFSSLGATFVHRVNA
jgi:hypothetical protein